MAKMAENCGGRYPDRTGDLLGVNDHDGRQLRRLAQTVRKQFRNKGPFGSVSVPQPGTDRTNLLLTAEELERVWGDFDPGPINFRKPPVGHIVYFVGGETGPVKIGWTQQPIKARLVCIQNGSPVKLHVLATAPAFRQQERMYHKQFAAYRLHGEWFERCPDIEAEIARLNADAPNYDGAS
jgi:hypothetical protein